MLTKKSSENKNNTPGSIRQYKQKVVGLTDVIAQLNQWAEAGTKDALEDLNKFIQNEKNAALRDYAEFVRGEAEYSYYSPQNEQEEKDFLLARLVWRRQEKLWEVEGKADAARLELKELNADRQTHQKLLKNLKDKNKKKEWQYNFSEDYFVMIKQRLEEMEEEIAYETAWLEQARKMVKIKKYQAPPVHIFKHIHFNGDGFSIWEDEMEIDERKPEQINPNRRLPELDEPIDSI
jgi:hypothetical protein